MDFNKYQPEEKIKSSREILDDKEKESIQYLGDLGLTWDMLKGKKVLEVGAAQGDLGLVAKSKGVDLVCLDMLPELYKERGGAHKNIEYVQGDAELLPFSDNTFDHVISHAAPPAFARSKSKFISQMGELLRVVKNDGELRIWPARIFPSVMGDEFREKNYDWKDLNLWKRGKEEFVRLFPQSEVVDFERDDSTDSPWFSEYFLIRKGK